MENRIHSQMIYFVFRHLIETEYSWRRNSFWYDVFVSSEAFNTSLHYVSKYDSIKPQIFIAASILLKLKWLFQGFIKILHVSLCLNFNVITRTNWTKTAIFARISLLRKWLSFSSVYSVIFKRCDYCRFIS